MLRVLRALRAATSDGLAFEAKDAAGNTTTKTVTVSVPMSQGGKQLAANLVFLESPLSPAGSFFRMVH